MDAATFKDQLTDAIRYWEPLRLAYNAVLALIVILYFLIGWPGSKQFVSLDGLLLVFVLAVLANVAYCAAYAVDIFAQSSGYRELWRRIRAVVFGVGTVFACVLTRWFAMSFFGLVR